jgi:NAD(P)-dependent dehydrogenase (short-subunit alcohol dehydrogenase family)
MIFDRFRIDNKVALVTGGTRGIGLAIAHALGEAGAKLIVASRTDKHGGFESLEKAGYDVIYFKADLTDLSKPQELVDFVLNKKGSLDILVNNAGVAQHGYIEKFDDKNLNKIMDLNVDAVFRMCRSAIIPMKEQGEGVILNIGSISGIVSNIPQRQVAYNASKAAVHMMTKSLASDFADKNIRVNAIAPGYIRTEMTQGGIDDKEMFPVWKKMTPMGRVGEPEEIAAAALFLCAPASSYVSGEVLVVDGAYLTR